MNGFDGSDDGWGLPDMEVKEKVLGQIMETEQPVFNFKNIFWKAAACVFLRQLWVVLCI